ncbi:hypothetical protein GUITHDRAFT_152456 [Guillardia theta CCMP2712]|uniref:non-specific serine/threonine protein kinase n=1 Tax=Guillardia theta (strain CCMP2712) TaxID=905079 RepID=L1JCS9_GUITC|nr:hypothetical protein GUITHDRAFT_152456 [Guillardia theta CCMP2712]EKX46301.1 hypothetical protein GUITHDRAFT_152456 [Guillardia theta CCMP2712]|mmetsp:Transcript_35653/g.111542  ORF Transcript_35653/g.111542 Transcript_35653/m.111542 type:complete len:416 (-) Transcript_35653:199-1446(-)|eukprot:XP_005833281.1 hypothetical protein GUITHDRAFT_152456 [Guillardia theta CCMP2712]
MQRSTMSTSSSSSSSYNLIGQLRGNKKYKLVKKLGSGSFGEIFLGTHVTNGAEVAIKLEPVRTMHPQLLYEAKVFRHLRGGQGIPEILWVGTEGDSNVMIMDLLGPSLEDLFNYCHRKFSLKTVLMVGDQMITRLEYIHSKAFLHRDVKPDNFLMGTHRKTHQVYIIDFGLSKRYVDPRTSQHIAYRTGKSLTGTARYASINTHLGLEQGRRDDLEGLTYVLLYFLRGQLPWQGLQAANQKEKYHKICLKKQNVPVRELCKGLPAEFGTLLCYCRNLKFEETPDYNYCRKLLREVFEAHNFTLDYVYDWTIKQREASSSGSSATVEPNPEILSRNAQLSAEAEPADSGPRERERERDKEKDKERERDREVDPGLTNSPMGVSSQNNALRGGAVKKSGGVNAKPGDVNKSSQCKTQ